MKFNLNWHLKDGDIRDWLSGEGMGEFRNILRHSSSLCQRGRIPLCLFRSRAKEGGRRRAVQTDLMHTRKVITWQAHPQMMSPSCEQQLMQVSS